MALDPALRARIPTLLTILRIALALPVAACIVGDSRAAGVAAFVLFLFAASLDFFDGRLARKWDVVSDIGRALDPIADKVLVAVVLLALGADGLLDYGWAWLPAVVIVGRDFLVAGLREYAAGARRTLHVTGLAKWKTTAELTALGLLLAAPGLGGLAGTAAPALYQGGVLVLWIAGALSAWTGAAYVRAVVRG